MASTIKVDQIEGSTGSTITVPTGQTLTLTDGLAVASLPTVTVAKGGTNLTSFTAGDVLYATGSTTLAKLPKGTAEQILSMNSGATAPEWTSVDVSVGGTGLASFTAGDILYATGATTLAKLAKGTTLQHLRMNAGATAPEWTAAPSGGLTSSTNFWVTRWGTAFDTNSTSAVDVTGGSLVLPTQSGVTNFLVSFNEMRQEENWNSTSGFHMYGTDGSTAGTQLGESHIQFNDVNGAHDDSERMNSGTYYVTFADTETPIFKLQARKWGSSNNYKINQLATDYSTITAIKIS